MRPLSLLTALSLALLGHAAVAVAQEKEAVSASDKIAEAVSAGPAELAENAAVVDWDGTVLREGTNGWTCFPDTKPQPGITPMCLDGQWLKWAHAWTNKQEEAGVTGIGIAYMLRGGWDASNTDPYATEPANIDDAVPSGPHLMVTHGARRPSHRLQQRRPLGHVEGHPVRPHHDPDQRAQIDGAQALDSRPGTVACPSKEPPAEAVGGFLVRGHFSGAQLRPRRAFGTAVAH
jgi:hypothetical protein